MTYTKNQLMAALDALRHQYPDEYWLWGKQRLMKALDKVVSSDIHFENRVRQKSIYDRFSIMETYHKMKTRRE